MYDEFEQRNTVVIAIAQEDTDLPSHAKFLRHFEPSPRFELVADLDRKDTAAYQRTSAYFIDTEGIVRQIFPATVHHRPAWGSILAEIDRLAAVTAPPP